MKNWKVESLGVLKHLDAAEAEKALVFVQQHKQELVQVLCCSWGIVLVLVFTAIMTVRLAMHIPL